MYSISKELDLGNPIENLRERSYHPERNGRKGKLNELLTAVKADENSPFLEHRLYSYMYHPWRNPKG